MLGRITGERIRNELNLLLQEENPEAGWLRLQELGVLKAIHTDLRFDDASALLFRTARQHNLVITSVDLTDMYWHLLLRANSPQIVESICERLLFPRKLQEALIQTAQLGQNIAQIAQPTLQRSVLVRMLEHFELSSIETHLLTSDDALIRARLRAYLETDRFVKPTLDGNHLKGLGLKPGPCFQRILSRLRDARLDEEVNTLEDEQRLLQRLLAEGICDDPVH
jgi:tRNA nucleotidyltransferase (CCA-adding enzyme)